MLPDGRLSEDIDLIAHRSRQHAAELLTTTLPRAVRREFPGAYWDPPLTQVSESGSAVFRTPEGLAVRFQLLSPVGYPPWPTGLTHIIQRYTDAPPAALWDASPALLHDAQHQSR